MQNIVIALICWLLLSCNSVYADPVPISQSDERNFITIADIHFTPFANCGATHPCQLIKKLKTASANQWASILAASNLPMSEYKQDSNYPLLTSALASAQVTAQQKQAKFVIVLGDTLGHDYRRLYKFYSGDSSYSGYQAFVRKTYQFINLQIAQAFPAISVYMVVGNNDSYRGDYATQGQGGFFQDQGALWSTLIKDAAGRNAMRSEFSVGGYYAVPLVDSNIKLIVLNTNFFATKARGKDVDILAKKQLNWLHDELLAARNTHQAVFIASHIPQGIDVYASLRLRGLALIEFWRTADITQFEAEMDEFAPEVSAIFAGHLHADWMQILRFKKMNEIPVTGTPSISPIFGNNPGYKVYTYSTTTDKLIDFETLYLPLNGKQLWSMEYQFNRVYQHNCHNCAVTAGIDLIHKDNMLTNYYRHFYRVGAIDKTVSAIWNPYYMCAIWHVDSREYKKCVA